MKFTHFALVLILSLTSAVVCPAQTSASPDPSDVNASTQPPTTSTAQTPASSPPKQDRPGDQPSVQTNPHDQNSAGDAKKNGDTKKAKDDRIFYVMPGKTYKTINIPGAANSAATDIDSAGDIVYERSNSSSQTQGALFHADKYYKFDRPERRHQRPRN